MMMLSENFGSIKFTYKLIFWGGLGEGGGDGGELIMMMLSVILGL